MVKLHAWLPVLAASVLLFGAAAASASPLEPGWEEAAAHLLAEPEALRTAQGSMSGVRLKVSVAPDGRVAAVTFLAGPPELRQAAIDEAMGLRFRPFERDGKAVAAVVALRIPVYAPERWGPAAPFPEGALSTVRISLQRSGCFGTCPAYRLDITGDGEITFRGEGYTLVEGEFHWRVNPAAVAALVEKFRAARFQQALDNYSADITDQSTQTLSLTIGGKAKTVIDYVGPLAGMPLSVRALEDAVDHLAGVQSVVEARPDTLARLQAIGAGPRSPYAAGIIVRAAASEPDEFVSALLDAGYPARAEAPAGWRGETLSAVAAAASRGHTELARRLIAAGGLEGSPADWTEEALRMAAGAARPELVKDLLVLHPDVNAPDAHGITALMLAAREQYPEVGDTRAQQTVNLLLAAGANPNRETSEGETALFGLGDAGIARALIAGGADLEHHAGSESGRPGDTPLCGTFLEDVAVALIDAGADFNAICWNGEPYLKYVEREHWPKVAEAVGRRRAAH